MIKNYDSWNIIKNSINNKNNKIVIPKEREVYWASIGVNIGYEQDGKGKVFSRPVLVLKKYNRHIFFGIPLSTQIKDGTFFYTLDLHDNKVSALLVQGRLFDTKRLENRIGMISKDDFSGIKNNLKELLSL
jgi:mRNA interferase MazF